MDYIEMIEQMRKELLQEVNQRCDDLISEYQNGISSKDVIRTCRLGWTSPAALKGKKPISLTFASGETIAVSTWKKAVRAILEHCNEQPDMHERLMQLRGKVFGRQRLLFGKSPENMDVPIRIDEELYFETKFDTEALITMMEKKVLEPIGYDFSDIMIHYMAKKSAISENLIISQNESGEDMSEENQGEWS